MRHRVSGRNLSRSSSHRSSLRRNMAASLFQYGAIRTTGPKAKELRRFVEKLITHAKKNTLHARRMVIAALGHDRAMYGVDEERMDKSVVQKLFDEIAPSYAERPGGYTRIVRLAERRIGDAGEQVILQLVEQSKAAPAHAAAAGASRRRRRATKRHTAATDAADKADQADQATTAKADQAQAQDEAAKADETQGEAGGNRQGR
jgi:large subunit ribosomal protein L17